MDQMTSTAVAMLAVLAVCFVALVLLVVTLPGVKKLFHREPDTSQGAHRAETVHPHPPGLRP